MSISINTTTTPQNAVSEVLSAKLSSSQQELEGEMALQLIQSVNNTSTPTTQTGSIGGQINIKV